jgi:hypothetical protein
VRGDDGKRNQDQRQDEEKVRPVMSNRMEERKRQRKESD